jgi:hypothetical protein
MWTITSLDLSALPGAGAFMSDGAPVVDTERGGAGVSARLMITGLGSIDITDMGAQSAGPQAWLIVVANQDYWCSGNAAMAIVAAANGTLLVTGDGNGFDAQTAPFPIVAEGDLDLFSTMVSEGLVPYPELIPPPPAGRPYADVAPVAADFFAYTPDAESFGLAVYDWTTADFFRMDVFNYYCYTAAPGQPLDGADIVNAIWTSNWPPYQPGNPQFMGSMMMQPCTSQAQVQAQYDQVSDQLALLLGALKRVTVAALASMPRTSVVATPALYSGQVDVSNLGETALATYFLEYPGNAGPPPAPMGMPLATALSGFMAPGAEVTLKSFMSTTDSQQDALNYSNGILLQISPGGDFPVWTQCAYVTPLSNEATKTEYLFMPGARFVMGQSSQETIGGKSVTVIPMTIAD